MNSVSSSPSVAAQWRSVRQLYPIYTAIASKFELGAAPFIGLDQLGSNSETEAIARIQEWLAVMDERIQPHQFRQMLQSTGIAAAEEKLGALVRRHLEKPSRGDGDRDKLDFLLTQYVCVCAPPSFQARELSLEEIAQVLEPVLGECATHVPQWLEPLELLIGQMRECRDLEQFESLEILQRGRELKASAGEKFFTPTSLLVFTRFSYSLRYTFARLFAAEAQAIEKSLRELEGAGTTTIDATDASLSEQEPIEGIRELLDAGTTSVVGAYAADDTSKRLCKLRAAVERAVTRTKLAMVEAYKARCEQLESELTRVRKELEEKRQECKRLVASAAENALMGNQEEVTAGKSPLRNSVPEPPPPQKSAPLPTTILQAADQSSAVSAAASTNATAEVTQCLASLRKLLRAQGTKPTSVLKIKTATFLLCEGELELLQSNPDPSDSIRKAMETAVATRALLVEKCELIKAGQAANLAPLIELARDLLGELQRLGGMHGPHHDTIVRTGRQLWSTLQQAEKTVRAVPA